MKSLWLIAVLGCSIPGCATTQPVIVAGDISLAADETFEAVRGAVRSLRSNGALNADQWKSWAAFEVRFKASYHAARLLYDGASSVIDLPTEQAVEQIIAQFETELATWQSLVVQLSTGQPAPTTGAR